MDSEHALAAQAVVATMSPLELVVFGLHPLAGANMLWEALEGVLALLRKSPDVLQFFSWDAAQLGEHHDTNFFVAIEALRDARQSEPWAAVAYCGFVALLPELRAYVDANQPDPARRLDTPDGASTLLQFEAIVDALICGHMDVTSAAFAFATALRLQHALADARR